MYSNAQKLVFFVIRLIFVIYIKINVIFLNFLNIYKSKGFFIRVLAEYDPKNNNT